MSRRVSFASVCLLVGTVSGVVVATPAYADDPTPTPTVTAPGVLPPILPSPSPTATSVGPVTDLTATVDSEGALVVAWQAGAGDTGYTAVASTAAGAKRVATAATRVSFTGLPAGASVQVTVTAHGGGVDGAPVSTTVAMPAAVPAVTEGAVRSVAAGLLVSWRPSDAALPGTRYLVELIGADGSRRSRLVAARGVTFAALVRGRLYSATITAVTDTGRSAAVDVDGAVWVPPSAVAPEQQPQAAAPAAPLPAAPVASVAATPAAAQATTPRTLVSSPLAAAGLAGLAVVLGGLAIGLLLRRPKARVPVAPSGGAPGLR